MSHLDFDFQVWEENTEANKPKKVKVLSRHDEPISPFQRWIDWEGTEGCFILANKKGTMFHFVVREGLIPIRVNVPRYTILCGERYQRRRPHPGHSY